MDFKDMGQLDANSEIEKGAIHSADVKGATVRLSNDFLELLNVVAAEVGLSRQAFMSKVIESYAPQAVADYLAGYSTSIHAKESAHQFFEHAAVADEIKSHLGNFADRVDDLTIDKVAYIEGLKALKKDNPAKLAYMHKERRIIQERFPDASFMTELPPLEGQD